MLKNISKLEIKIGDHSYQFLCDNDSPIGEVKESIIQLLKYVCQIDDNIKAQQAAQAAQAAQVAESNDSQNVESKVEAIS